MTATTYTKSVLTVIMCALLGGCSAADRIANIGQAPEMTRIANPVTQRAY